MSNNRRIVSSKRNKRHKRLIVDNKTIGVSCLQQTDNQRHRTHSGSNKIWFFSIALNSFSVDRRRQCSRLRHPNALRPEWQSKYITQLWPLFCSSFLCSSFWSSSEVCHQFVLNVINKMFRHFCSNSELLLHFGEHLRYSQHFSFGYFQPYLS